MTRRFTRFGQEADPSRLVFQVPLEGLCLSTFLVLRPRGHPDRALLGHIDPKAPWDELGAADAGRVVPWSKGWMLPSSQLVFYESPADAARRIAQEQLGVTLGDLPAPVVMSDAYARTPVSTDKHWDFGFVYVLDGQPETPPHHSGWTDLRYVEVAREPSAAFVRYQEDVLRLVGMPCATGSK